MSDSKFHPLTGAPIAPLGYRRNGKPIWPIMGGSEDAGADELDADDGEDSGADEADDSEADESDDEQEDDGSEELGDAGKQALDRMKAKLKDERTKRREAEAKLADKSGSSEQDKRDSEALSRANARIVKSEVKAAAKGVLADPADAYKFLDLSEFEVDDDGNVDEDEIADAIDALVKEKPYLAAQGGRRFKGGADGGARKESRPKQLTRADLQGMSPTEIDKAHKEGRLQDLLKS